jgi:hypothetical protein
MARNDVAVNIKVDLTLANPDNRVEYELWYASIFDLPTSFIKEIGQYHMPFGKNALFTPRVVTFDFENGPDFVRKNECVSNGKYCPYYSHEESIGEEFEGSMHNEHDFN